MADDPYIDPLSAAAELLELIAADSKLLPSVEQLASRIDKLVFALRHLLVEGVASIPETDDDPPSQDSAALYVSIGKRFPKVGPYWRALDSRVMSDKIGEISGRDAINDLADIAEDLAEVRWYQDHHGREEALAALRWRYEHHLYMHIMPLRDHLEELIHLGQENDKDQPR